MRWERLCQCFLAGILGNYCLDRFPLLCWTTLFLNSFCSWTMSTTFGHRSYLFMLYLWPDPDRPTKAHLPKEIWTAIFEQYCWLLGPSLNHYTMARDDLSRKHSGWAAFIAQDPLFWRNIAVTIHTPLESVRLALERAGETGLHVDIFLDSVVSRAFDKPRLSQAAALSLDNTRSVVLALAAKSDLWLTARMVDNAHHSQLLLDNVASIHCSSLTSLHFALPHVIEETPSWPDSEVFRLHAPLLRDLSLFGIVLPWSAMGSFLGLRTLRLRYVGSGSWPTSEQFASVLSSADSLRLLSITGTFRLMSADVYAHPPLLLPYLDELDLSSVCSDSDDSFDRLVASIRAPALRILRLSHFTVGFRDLICESALAASAEFIFLMGYIPFDTQTMAFVGGFKAVTHLALKECGPCYLQALLADPNTCPLLASLVLARVRVVDVYVYVQERMARNCSITALTFYHTFSSYKPPSRTEVDQLRSVHTWVPGFVGVPDLDRFLFV
ncbi:hypothetical protein C8J57DRAFT_117813 [Mycena rebaudengoi]|nr:hypothetical protein C8J57DRAFT_117813 [Mycena rebaudengoi]